MRIAYVKPAIRAQILASKRNETELLTFFRQPGFVSGVKRVWLLRRGKWVSKGNMRNCLREGVYTTGSTCTLFKTRPSECNTVLHCNWNYDLRIRDSAQSVEERPVESRERKEADAVAHELGWQIRRGGKSHRLVR